MIGHGFESHSLHTTSSLTLKVNINVSVDIYDVFSELTYSEQMEFIKSYILYKYELKDIVEEYFGRNRIAEFVEDNIDKISDETLINELKDRDLIRNYEK